MATIWITPDLATPGKYAYNATITDGEIKVRFSLLSDGFRDRYTLSYTFEKARRGRFGSHQEVLALALKAELEPLFRAALAAAGWREFTIYSGTAIRWQQEAR